MQKALHRRPVSLGLWVTELQPLGAACSGSGACPQRHLPSPSPRNAQGPLHPEDSTLQGAVCFWSLAFAASEFSIKAAVAFYPWGKLPARTAF